MRVALVSTCGAGHLNALRSLWSPDDGASKRLFLVRFNNDPHPFENQHAANVLVITLNEERPSENATVFNAARSKALQDVLHVWLYDYAPTLIVYDFFCLEARNVARKLGVPAICSIPATLKPDEKETCSDALLPQEHMYWVWRAPYDVAIEPVKFLGPRPAEKEDLCYKPYMADYEYDKTVIVTFGTVVPKYAGCHERFKLVVQDIQAYAKRHPELHFIFAGCDGGRGLNCTSYPNADDVDLPTALRYVKYLIFHGGGNTYAEALDARVPYILCCPFFGDQFETARQCGNVYSGDLEHDMQHLKPCNYEANKVLDAPFQDDFSDYWKRGDLLFGHRRHRSALQLQFPRIDLHLEQYKSFASFAHPDKGDLPAIADVYNDELALSTPPLSGTPYHERLHQVAVARFKRLPSVLHLPEDHRLVHHCLDILQLTVTQWKGRIHFVLGALDELGPATRIELDYIERNWSALCDFVLFYNVQGKRIPAPFAYSPKTKSITACKKLIITDSVSQPLLDIPGRMPCVWGRWKSSASVMEKVMARKLPLLDATGWRTGYLNREDLKRIQSALNPLWRVSVCWCTQRVWYYYYDDATELQVWPWTYLHCFYLGLPEGEAQVKMQEAVEQIEL